MQQRIITVAKRLIAWSTTLVAVVSACGCSTPGLTLNSCGNGALEEGEQCDDGNLQGGDGCEADCSFSECQGDCCGNGVVDAGEECDDGNLVDDDGCDATCRVSGCQGDCCGNGVVDSGEQCDDGNLVDDDGCDTTCRFSGCQGDCSCGVREDITQLIGTNDLYVGLSTDGEDFTEASCGGFEAGREVYLSFTPDFDGELILSTSHPTTSLQTVLEVRADACDGAAIDCAAGGIEPPPAARLSLEVQAGRTLVAMVETAGGEEGAFSLGLHQPGVCEGVGVVEEITADLLSGRYFVVDTLESTSSMRGSCSATRDGNPEALLTFVPPQAGIMVATTAHPDTDFNTLLYVREGNLEGETFCDSPDAEAACANDTTPWGTSSVIRFDVEAGLPYSLFVDGGSADGRGEATVVLGYEQPSPVVTSLEGCDHDGLRDSFAFFAEEGQVISLVGDTVDTGTAADLRLRIRNPGGSERHMADDDRACTYPPPEWSCPEYQFTVGTGGLYSVEVYVGASEECYDRSRVNYELSVTANGAPLPLIQTRND